MIYYFNLLHILYYNLIDYLNEMYLILKLIDLYFYPTTNILHLIFLFMYFLPFFY